MTIPIEGWPEESEQRLQKLQQLREQGINPYPNRFVRTHTLGEIVAAYGEKPADELESLDAQVKIAGRVMTKRGMGKASFLTLSDGGATLQLFIRQNEVGAEAYTRLDLVDRGDFVGASGKVMRTKTGELSVQAKDLTFLSKALLPPPEKWHGLSDVEVRYRQRYADLIANPEVRRTFVARSRMVGAIRRFLDERGYFEVETPMMQAIPGGALARPFVTHHNALDIDLYLRIAPELYLKRLVVGGLERVYEINRNFRNEGISSMHNPEFTMLEFYTAYFDCRDVIATTEELLAAAAHAVGGDGPFKYKEREVSFKTPFRRVTMKDAAAQALAEVAGFQRGVLDDAAALETFVKTDAFQSACAREGVSAAEYGKLSHGKRISQLFEDFAEESLWEPTFIIDYPVEISPLAKTHAENPQVADRFELYMAGMEVANGFSELNDPLEQRERFLDQLRQREGGDAEAHLMDEDYIRALGHGLPPTGGCGVGIDRLTMVLTGSPSIRDVILFPQMRPQGASQRSEEGLSPDERKMRPETGRKAE
jgi:lysyl-tRNA synthetase class 2